MRFENQIALSVPREKVWQFLWDVDSFITCVPGCKEAKSGRVPYPD
jgi:carbon monoxide dehydrogenase subunit G